ncbi:pectinesterase family protein [Paenibacillus sp. WLX1005]|uniref:pectinesterase family protein n=1 Tax=Paenibacillus sp. WLX1005 TaxID=3243766 RepID=UPI0039843885
MLSFSLLPASPLTAHAQDSTSTVSIQAAQAQTITVAKDGSGQFTTVQAAINSIESGNKNPINIYVKNGTYTEKLTFPQDKPYITLTGQSADKTILTYNDTSASAGGTTNSSSTFVMSDHFTAQTITFANTAGKDAGQAVALYVRGDRAIFKNVRILGNQDTLYTPGTGRQYYENCYIEGTVDFVFGSATAYFNNCELKSLGNGYVTAASTAAEQTYGYVFRNCKLTRASSVTNASVYLGRPWRPYASVAFLNSSMDSHIRPEGWNNWSNAENEKTARYSEYGSTGSGGTTSKRVSWSKQLTAQQAAQLTPQNVLRGSDNWNPAGS